MKHLLVPVTALALTAAASAQIKYTVTPRGTDLVELSSSSSIALNWSTGNTTRIQQADNAHTGKLRILKSIAWRRNGTAARATTYTPKLSILLAHADYSKFSTTFASNYKSKTTTVFSGTQKLDWTKASPLPVGLWSDATFPFSSTFIYNGTDALLWETQTTSTSTTSSGYSVDWSASRPATRSSLIPQVLGTGCAVGSANMTLKTSFTVNATPTYTSKWDVTNAGSGSSVSLYIGLTNPNIPLFCGRLHTDALLSAPLGSTSAGGAVSQTITGTWMSGFAGAPLMTQALAINGSNAYLSNGIFLCLPKAVGGAPFLVKRIYSTSSHTATTSSGSVTNSCQVTQFK